MNARRLKTMAGLALAAGLLPGLARGQTTGEPGAEPGKVRATLAIASNGRDPAPPPPASLAPSGLWPADERAAVLIAHADRKLAEARFDEALVLTGRARELLAPYGRKRRALRYKSRLEVTAATAFVALERRSEALACFERALALAPELELEPSRTSPKVLRVFREARSAR